MNSTNNERIKEIEKNLSYVHVLSDRQWELYFSLNPRTFYAKNKYSGEIYDLGGSKNLTAKYFNTLVRNEVLPPHVRLIQKAVA